MVPGSLTSAWNRVRGWTCKVEHVAWDGGVTAFSDCLENSCVLLPEHSPTSAAFKVTEIQQPGSGDSLDAGWEVDLEEECEMGTRAEQERKPGSFGSRQQGKEDPEAPRSSAPQDESTFITDEKNLVIGFSSNSSGGMDCVLQNSVPEINPTGKCTIMNGFLSPSVLYLHSSEEKNNLKIPSHLGNEILRFSLKDAKND